MTILQEVTVPGQELHTTPRILILMLQLLYELVNWRTCGPGWWILLPLDCQATTLLVAVSYFVLGTDI